jgi:hypothetical protein
MHRSEANFFVAVLCPIAVQQFWRKQDSKEEPANIPAGTQTNPFFSRMNLESNQYLNCCERDF